MSRSMPLLYAMCVVVSLNELALGQGPDIYRAPSGLEGNAGTELSAIRRRDIGTGYSGATLNRQSLSSASIRTPFVGGYTGQTIVGGVNNVSGPSAAPRASAPSFGLGVGGPANKPFSNASSGPTVSPYLNLFREDLDGFSDFNYQTLVRPQLQQQQINQDLQRQQLETNRQVQSLSARQDYNPAGSETQAPTGHSTTFRYHSHYYPTIGQNRRAK